MPGSFAFFLDKGFVFYFLNIIAGVHTWNPSTWEVGVEDGVVVKVIFGSSPFGGQLGLGLSQISPRRWGVWGGLGMLFNLQNPEKPSWRCTYAIPVPES